jgi:hypothetical protein
MAKIAFTGATTNYSFPIAGRRILVAAADTALPSSITPIDDSNIPSGWTDLGPTENQEVTLNLTRQTEAIQVGVIPTDVRKYITGQSGSLEANLMRFEPDILGYQAGVSPEAAVAASGGNREYIDIFLGGTLGDIISVLTFEDFDIDLDDDAGSNSYEQVWYYSPAAQSDGDINLSARITKANAVALRFTLLAFTNVAAGDRNILLQQRWLMVA